MNLVNPQTKVQKSKKRERITKNRQRIELLSQSRVARDKSRTFITSLTNLENHEIIQNRDHSISIDSALASKRYRKVTPRLLRLAEPKYRVTTAVNLQKSSGEERMKEPSSLMAKDPFKVNPRALKASCSSRIEELARPKGYNITQFSQLLKNYLDRIFIPPE